MGESLVLDGTSLTIFDVVHAARDGKPVEIADSAWQRVRSGREQVERVLANNGHAYGVTTGVGSQKSQPLTPQEISAFNNRLIVAHASVASEMLLSPNVVRAALVVQLNALSTGLSGIRPELLERLHQRYCSAELPAANAGASVGASDLVPLAQMALPLLGLENPLGDLEPDVTQRTSVDHPPVIDLAAKEGLSLINSNAVSLGHGALVLLQARKLLRGFDLSACFSLEGFRGNLQILHRAVTAAHPQRGQIAATQHMRRLLKDSALWQQGAARNLQDPLSFRCAPQVHGAIYSALEWVWKNWEVELNTVQDNPCVDLLADQLVSHGNMDSTLLTLGMDNLRLALATAVDISAQRLHKLHWPAFSDLPPGLAQHSTALGGVQFLNLSHIAEAYAATARTRTRPSLSSYHGQLADGVEDHATLLPMSVTETERFIDVAWVVQAIELTVASWAIRRRGIDLSELGQGLRAVYEAIEPLLPIGREGEHVFDIRPIVELVRDGEIVDLIDDDAPPVPPFSPVEIMPVADNGAHKSK